MNPILRASILLVPVLTMMSFYLGPKWYASIIVFYSIGIFALEYSSYYVYKWWKVRINAIFGSHKKTDSAVFGQLILGLSAFLFFAAFLYALFLVKNRQHEVYQIVLLALATGSLAAVISVPVAHEFGHKRQLIYRIACFLQLICYSYFYFFIEHFKGHHANIGTRKDPATARYKESFYMFLPRAIFGAVWSAFKIEKKRSPGYWTLFHSLLLVQLLVYTAVFYFLSFKGILFLGIVSLVAISLTEAVNYIEHYGLKRIDETASTGWNSPMLSWNSDFLMERVLLFELIKHSEHHVDPQRSFQDLKVKDNYPRLPKGYAFMLLLAFFPPLWFKEMHKTMKEQGLLPDGN